MSGGKQVGPGNLKNGTVKLRLKKMSVGKHEGEARLPRQPGPVGQTSRSSTSRWPGLSTEDVLDLAVTDTTTPRMFGLSEEHRAIREAVRDLCAAKVAPYAADVDENARYPEEAAAALQAADFHAPHVPEEYGGAGADALATVLVIEEVARVCMASSLIPAVNKLGSLPVLLAGSEELKKSYLARSPPGTAASPTASASRRPARTRSRCGPAPSATATTGCSTG